MMARIAVRRGIRIAAFITTMFAAPFPAAAQSKRIIAEFTGTTANLNPGGGETLKIDLLEWSSLADREKLLAALKDKGESATLDVLEAARTVGFIWAEGSSIGYSVRYADHVVLPDGGERIILAANVRLGRSNPWKAVGQNSASDYPFTVIELRLNRRGVGEGKMSLTAKITADDQDKTVELAGYESAPVLLKIVKRELGENDQRTDQKALTSNSPK